jgi:hypothetical protein
MPYLQVLDELGIRSVTDKCSLFHDYLSKYERLFAPFRDTPITLLEIGVFNGGSLRLWEDYFPRATIVGLDIRAECKQHEGGRRVVEIASQADAAAMSAIGQRYQPTIIIDDGSHQADHILNSFQALYPTLRDGGIYIVEDLDIHAGIGAMTYRGSAPYSPQRYFLQLANRVVCPAEEVEIDYKVVWATEAVEFFQKVTVVRKKQAPEPDGLENRRIVVQQANSNMMWGGLSRYLLNNGGSVEEAIECAERANAMSARNWTHLEELSRALERAGRLEEALAAAEEAESCAPHLLGLHHAVTRLTAKIEARSEFDGKFDERWYLDQNPDVARAVAEGRCTALEHYVSRGRDEGRLPLPPDDWVRTHPQTRS